MIFSRKYSNSIILNLLKRLFTPYSGSRSLAELHSAVALHCESLETGAVALGTRRLLLGRLESRSGNGRRSARRFARRILLSLVLAELRLGSR